MSRPTNRWFLVAIALVVSVGIFLLRHGARERRADRETSPGSRAGGTGMSSAERPFGGSSPRGQDLPQDFEALLARALRDLPTRAALRDLTEEEAHQPLAALDLAGEVLGEVAERIRAHPELAPRAARFYDECARAESYLTAVRALCLGTADQLPARFPEARLSAPDRRGIPEDVVRLARELK